MSDFTLTSNKCPHCQLPLTQYGTSVTELFFYCQHLNCRALNDSIYTSCIIHIDRTSKEITYYRFVINNFLLEGKNNMTTLKSPNKVLSSVPYFYPIKLDSDWLQDAAPIFQKLMLYNTLS